MRESIDNGLGVLDGDQVRLLRTVDSMFMRLADSWNAAEFRFPFLLRCADLDAFDYYENFPHLGLAATRLDTKLLAASLADAPRPIEQISPELMEPATLVLPSAACYAIYLDLAGSTLPADGTLRTTVGTCFRNEEQYQGLSRLLGFSMREIVFVGSADGAKRHLLRAKGAVADLCAELGLDLRIEVATDPFFDRNGSRARVQRLFPVKEEFLIDGLATGSVNYHRNFFGERCSIRTSEDTAHTSCLAFGLERWVHVLTRRFGSPTAAVGALESLV